MSEQQRIIRHERIVETSVTVMVRTRMSAWVAEKTTDAQVRQLKCRERLASAQAETAEAEWDARRRAGEAALRAQEVAAENEFRVALYARSSETRREIIGRELEAERILGERERLRRQRLNPPVPPAPQSTPALPPGVTGHPAPGALTVHVDSKKIEELALRAFTRMSQMPAEQADAAWVAWRQELLRRLPPGPAAEVERRVAQLRGIAG